MTSAPGLSIQTDGEIGTSICEIGDVNATEHTTRIVNCALEDLRPHPSLVRLQLVPTARNLSDAIARADQSVSELVTITRERFILTGQPDWELAIRKGQNAITCLQLNLTEEEALLWLIQRHRQANGLNHFNRILLALELEPSFKTRAHSNQQLGGQVKGSSKLSEAERVDVRGQIATAAGVSVGNVSKVKRLVAGASPEVLEALRNGEASIYRAASWLDSTNRQIDELRWFRNHRGIERSLSTLLSKHEASVAHTSHCLDICRVAKALLAMASNKEKPVFVGELEIPGNALLLSSDLIKALEIQGGLFL